MSDQSPQSFSHHAKWDPPFHFFIVPVFAVSLLVNTYHLYRQPGRYNAWMLLFVFVVVASGFKARLYALKVQDRVIRLEERLRMQTLLSEPLRSRIGELTEDQLIGLRFASDTELSALVEKTLTEKLDRKQIKAQIKNWRPDFWRV